MRLSQSIANFVAIAIFTGTLFAQQDTTKTTPAFKSEKEKTSYAIGMNIGKSLKSQSVDVDLNIFQQGLKDGFSGGNSLLSPEETRAVLMNLQNELQQKEREKRNEIGEKNKKEGEAFLSANKEKKDIVTLPSGLQYKILQAGTGAKPTLTDSVTCNYKGTFIDGTEFDSSYKRGTPAEFPVAGIIKGWSEALQLMPVGSKWQLFVPSTLAYGERGAGTDIGPNATLVFEVELLAIKSK